MLPDIPPDVVCQMIAEMKVHRSVRPWRNNPDDHHDQINYAKMAAECNLDTGRYEYDATTAEGYLTLRKASDPEGMDFRTNRVD